MTRSPVLNSILMGIYLSFVLLVTWLIYHKLIPSIITTNKTVILTTIPSQSAVFNKLVYPEFKVHPIFDSVLDEALSEKDKALIKRTRLFVLDGQFPIESGLQNNLLAINPELTIINASKYFSANQLQYMDPQDPSSGINYYSFLDPSLLSKEVYIISDTIKSLYTDMEKGSSLSSNADSLFFSLQELDRDLKTRFSTQGHKTTIITFTPFLSYFSNRYGLNEEILSISSFSTMLNKPAPEHSVLIIRPEENINRIRELAKARRIPLIIFDPIHIDNYENELKDLAKKIIHKSR